MSHAQIGLISGNMCRGENNVFAIITRAYANISKVHEASTVSICYPNTHTKFHLYRSTRGNTLKNESWNWSLVVLPHICRENRVFAITRAYANILMVYKASTFSISYPNVHTKFYLYRSTRGNTLKNESWNWSSFHIYVGKTVCLP